MMTMASRLCMLVAALALAACVRADDLADKCKTVSGDGKKEYDINVLSIKSGNDFSDNYHVGQYGRVEPGIDDYTFYLNVCHGLVHCTPTDASFCGMQDPYYGTPGVIQRVVKADGTEDATGTFEAATINGAALVSLFDGDLRYQYSSAPTKAKDDPTKPDPLTPSRHCDSRTSTIFLYCSDVGLGNPVFIEEFNDCNYVFFWHTCAACPLGSPIRNACPAIYDDCKSRMHAGSVLVITFFVCLTVYIVGGVLYNRFVKGAKGWDQCPNYDFWSDLFGLMRDGCATVCPCLGRRPTPHVVSYQGLDERIDGPSDEDDDLDDDADEELFP